jgi:hypothetical protein
MLITCCLCSQCVHHVPTGYLGPCPQCHAQEKVRSWVERVETPTPDLYTPVLTDTEMDVEDVGTGAQTSMTTITSAYGCSSLTP